MRNFKKKSCYLAVLLVQSYVAMAEEPTAKPTTESVESMDQVEVKSSKEKPQVNYQSTKTRVGKTVQDPQDIPQAITTVTKDLIRDQQISSLKDALRNVSGLTFNAAEGGRAGDNFMLRGFYTFGDTYLDNMRDTAQYNRELFNLEQVDVLRGSAAMLFGRGQAGGVVNQVSKMAELSDESIVTGSVGNYSYHQLTGDFNKQLTETAAIRVNLMDRHEETYRSNPATGDHPVLDRQGLAISFGAGIGTDNTFYLNHVYTKTRDVPDFGVRFDNGKPIANAGDGRTDKTFWGSKVNFDDSDTNIITGIFTHQFAANTQLRTQFRHAHYERQYWAKTPATTLPIENNGVGGNVTRNMDYKTINLQTDFSTQFDLASMYHDFLAGAEYLKEDSYRKVLQAFNLTTGLPYTGLTNQQIAAIAATEGIFYNGDIVSSTGNAVSFDADNYALYLQDTVEFVKNWKATLGVRRDEMRAKYASSTSPKLIYGENSYRAGLSYQPEFATHYYLSYSDSFSPTADLYQLTVTPLPPERSETIELGAKWLFWDGDLSFRTALYSATKDWERNTDLESTAAILTKKRRTNGLEFELAGQLTDDWDIFAGLALMDAKILEVAENVNATTGVITQANPNFKGQRARNTPVATFNFWTNYAISNQWKVGGGIEAKGERYAYVPSSTSNALFSTGKFSPNTAPGFARVDAMVAYELKDWTMRLNIKNLLNKTYYDAVYDNGGLVLPGNRRQAIFTAEYHF